MQPIVRPRQRVHRHLLGRRGATAIVEFYPVASNYRTVAAATKSFPPTRSMPSLAIRASELSLRGRASVIELQPGPAPAG